MRRRNQYTGLFAEFYDILHAGLGDVDLYVEWARKYRPKVLELGSGTGRFLISLAYAGLEVTGVDLSDDMIAMCKKKLMFESPDVRSRTRIIKGNVVDLDLGETFDLVIAPCNIMNCLTGPGDGLALLKTARQHLGESGTFILDMSIPDIPFMVKSQGMTRTFEFEHPLTGTTIVERFTASYDFVLQLETDHIVLEEYDDGTLLRREETIDRQTFYFPREIRTMPKPQASRYSTSRVQSLRMYP